MHIELRVRTLCELVLNQEYYLKPEVISYLNSDCSVVRKNVLPATSAGWNEASQSTSSTKSVARTCLEILCINTPHDGAYSEMWHIHGLASAIQHPITSIYPDVNPRIAEVFNRVAQPRLDRGEARQYQCHHTEGRKTDWRFN